MEVDFAIMISVTFFFGKRETPPYLHNYRPHLVVKDDNEYLGVCFIEGSACEFNRFYNRSRFIPPPKKTGEFSAKIC